MRSPKKQNIDDAVKESEAQTAVLKALARLPVAESRVRVINAIRHLIEADNLVPGILAAFVRGAPSEHPDAP